MASLREIKSRINSVNSTRKITSAMKMIASAKLRKAQTAITNFLPYQKKLDAILTNLLSSDIAYDSPFLDQREVKRVAIIAFSSNSSLCGAYNANVVKEFKSAYGKVSHLGKENVLVYPVGKMMSKAIQRMGITAEGSYEELIGATTYEGVQEFAKVIIDKYTAGELDEVILIYHHFVSTGTQILSNAKYLPFDLNSEADKLGADESANMQSDYIFEPTQEEIMRNLIPVVLYSRMYAALLDASASEHASRTIAMQVATDNADDLIQDLTIQYNKSRQQGVTNELLDIIGGASALQG